jgi:hypothetical protein
VEPKDLHVALAMPISAQIAGGELETIEPARGRGRGGGGRVGDGVIALARQPRPRAPLGEPGDPPSRGSKTKASARAW